MVHADMLHLSHLAYVQKAWIVYLYLCLPLLSNSAVDAPPFGVWLLFPGDYSSVTKASLCALVSRLLSNIIYCFLDVGGKLVATLAYLLPSLPSFIVGPLLLGFVLFFNTAPPLFSIFVNGTLCM